MKGTLFFALALVPLLALPLFSSSVVAATKVLDVQQYNMYFIFGPFGPVKVCGVTDVFTEQVHVGTFSIVLWDNGHFQLMTTGTVDLLNSAGQVILKNPNMVVLVFGDGGLPISFQKTIIAVCTGASATPGQPDFFILGETIGVDGALRQGHFFIIPGEVCLASQGCSGP